MRKYKYEIANTTRNQRKFYARDAEMSRLGGGQESSFARRCMEEYVNGKIELSDAKAKVVAKYKRI